VAYVDGRHSPLTVAELRVFCRRLIIQLRADLNCEYRLTFPLEPIQAKKEKKMEMVAIPLLSMMRPE
jgi:hypothetical protein